MTRQVKIPAGHPAFWPIARAAIFATRPVVELRNAVFDVMETGDQRTVERAVAELRHAVYVGTPRQWRKVGIPQPGNLDDLKHAMARAGFSPDFIHELDWAPCSVLPIIFANLGRGETRDREPRPGPQAGPPVDVTRGLSKTHRRLLDVLWAHGGPITWGEFCGLGWPELEGGTLESSARAEFRRLRTALRKAGYVDLIDHRDGQVWANVPSRNSAEIEQE